MNKYPHWLQQIIPQNTEQCDRLKDITLEYFRKGKMQRFKPTKFIKSVLHPFCINDFKRAPEEFKKMLLDTYLKND